MFLKRMETIGFKSFAERVKMDFVSGVTAVVGPNGSGKSNVIDAIRWVLGEQSARSIRGEKMEDIIFQGSDSRKALNFAEVSLILNNEEGQLPIDYEEVNVTRRVYRSGESEFYLNKQACRLKDIIELFMDTGLGKESFSIIGQGRIDEILSSKSDDRRAVFEEAAGVLKYKQRKKKAEYKLVEASDNLDRVEDILHEITEQLGPLETQAATAKKYQAYQEELKTAEISLLVTEIGRLHDTWQQVLKEIEKDQQQSVEKKTAIQKKEAVLTEERETVEKLDQQITELQQAMLEMTEQLEQQEGKRNVLLEQAKHEQENKEKLKEQRELSENRLLTLEQTRANEKEQLEAITKETNRLKTKIRALEANLQTTPEELEAKIEDVKSDYIEQLNEQAVTKNELERLKVQSKQVKAEQEQRQQTYQTSREAESDLAERKEYYQRQAETLKQALTEQEEGREHIYHRLAAERKQLEAMQQKLAAGNEQAARLMSRKEMLEEMKESYQGFFLGAKEILQAKTRGDLANVFGAVIDLIQIPAKYMTAMETVLGGQAQHIVVEDDAAARNGINWLKRNHKGRATFLPLQSIVPKYFPSGMKEKLKDHPGFIGVAADLIETEPDFDVLRTYLLGNVLVANELRDANELAKQTNRKFRIVTLDGDIVFPGGSMSGGAKKKNNQSLFIREKEITELAAKLNDFNSRVKDYEIKIEDKKQQIEQLNKDETAAVKHTEAAKQSLEEVQQALHEVSLNYSRAAAETSNYEAIRMQYEAEEKEITDKKQNLIRKHESLQTALADKEAEIDALSERKQAVEQNRKEIEEELHAYKIRQAEQEERRKAVHQRYETAEKQYKEESLQLTSTENALEGIMDEADRAALERRAADAIHQLKQKREITSNQLETDRVKRNEVVQKTSDDEQEVKGMQRELDAFTKMLQEKEVEANRLDVTLENYLQRLQQAYKITYERAAQEYTPATDVEQTKQEVEALTTAIERLGTVNLGAIDEFERLTSREAFLRQQQNDLLEAKETLYNVIQEMDAEMTKQFSEVFYEIQSAFSNVFQTLFGGGHASLTLTDPEHLLETGIDIAARPPGKKLKTLELLSGGERALTAIALLFAILHVRPVPFCILDEVDAALDEANIERFGKYLQTFSKDTQFIVITHRKGTMEEADALYGVTMQESGVSRLVSVKLKEAKPLVGMN